MTSWWRNMSDIFYILSVPEMFYYHVITLKSSLDTLLKWYNVPNFGIDKWRRIGLFPLMALFGHDEGDIGVGILGFGSGWGGRVEGALRSQGSGRVWAVVPGSGCRPSASRYHQTLLWKRYRQRWLHLKIESKKSRSIGASYSWTTYWGRKLISSRNIFRTV